MEGSQIRAVGTTYGSIGSVNRQAFPVLHNLSEAFIMLGLPETDVFWQGKDLPWTTKKIWDGKVIPADHAN
jgi:hypothetical protein